MGAIDKTKAPSQTNRKRPPVATEKPTWREVFAALDAAQFPDDFLEDRDAGLSPNPEQREDLQVKKNSSGAL
ncbi:MAG TPA: hypothetical protein VGG42_02145 [Acidobacteriaceae bacterium]